MTIKNAAMAPNMAPTTTPVESSEFAEAEILGVELLLEYGAVLVVARAVVLAGLVVLGTLSGQGERRGAAMRVGWYLCMSVVLRRFRAMKVIPIPVRHDNYSYLLVDDNTKHAAAIDPYDVPKLQATAAHLGVHIVANITTHHHFDHSGGNKEFATAYPSAPIYGGSDKIPALTNLVKDKDEFTVGHNIHVRCLANPCHTRDSICYYVTDKADSSYPGGVFTGDTLFIGGCGRFFEGTGDDMHSALSYLATLPDKTIVYNGHEYTAGNAAFAKSIDPNNPHIDRLDTLAKDNKVTTGLTTIGDEEQWNVFMRLKTDSVLQATGAGSDASNGQIMDLLRELKNNFRG